MGPFQLDWDLATRRTVLPPYIVIEGLLCPILEPIFLPQMLDVVAVPNEPSARQRTGLAERVPAVGGSKLAFWVCSFHHQASHRRSSQGPWGAAPHLPAGGG